MDTKILRLDEVIVDNSLNPRVGALDQETVLDYSAHVDDLPAMTVFDGRNWPQNPGLYLVGGFHRFAAHRLAGRDVAKFVVRQGSREAAEEAADLDNLTHGLHLTRAERRGVIRRYLKRHPERSDVWIAKETRTTDKTVRAVREEMESASEIPTLDVLIDVNGIRRPRSIERPQKPDADEEAKELTIPFQLGAAAVVGETQTAQERRSLEQAVKKSEGRDVLALATFKAQPCPDCQSENFYWQDPETVSCYVCGREWDKLAWRGRVVRAALADKAEAAVEAAEGEARRIVWSDLGTDGAWRDDRGKGILPPEWATMGTDGKWYNVGPDGKPDYDAPVRKGAFPAPPWYLEMFSLTVPAPQPAESQAASEPEADAPEWLSEEGEAEEQKPTLEEYIARGEAEDAELDREIADFEAETAPPAPVVEPRLAAIKPAPASVAPPPPPPPPPPAKPALPPPPPPVVGRAPLTVTVTVYANGNALLTAAASSDFRRDLSGPGVEMAANVERLIEIYLREEAVKEEPVNDNAV
jgi:hypothetical protein